MVFFGKEGKAAGRAEVAVRRWIQPDPRSALLDDAEG